MALTALIRGETAWFAWHRTAKAQPGREGQRLAKRSNGKAEFDWPCDGFAQRSSDLHCNGIAVI